MYSFMTRGLSVTRTSMFMEVFIFYKVFLYLPVCVCTNLSVQPQTKCSGTHDPVVHTRTPSLFPAGDIPEFLCLPCCVLFSVLLYTSEICPWFDRLTPVYVCSTSVPRSDEIGSVP